MTYQVVFTDAYVRRAAKWLKRHPEAEQQYLKTLQLLELNPFHPSLRLHALAGRLEGLYLVSINLSFRIRLEFLVIDKEILLVNVGDHESVYR
jgi:mRNA-degrading endonuclease YafQ of YafQ-DinJ toxin-antitoxin module